MNRWLGTVSALFIILSMAACAPKSQSDCGFIQNVYGERVSWKADAPVTMYLHSSVPDSMVPAIVSAAETWEKTAGKKLFNIVTTSRQTGLVNPHKDGVNVIYFMDSWEANLASEQARTSVYWIGDQIKEADIRLNAADFSFYWNGQTLSQSQNTSSSSKASVNIEALVLHEMGHVLGLKHKDGVGSVMATYLSGGEDRVHLASIDSTDLKCEY